jgi:hypothetical protein
VLGCFNIDGVQDALASGVPSMLKNKCGVPCMSTMEVVTDQDDWDSYETRLNERALTSVKGGSNAELD